MEWNGMSIYIKDWKNGTMESLFILAFKLEGYFATHINARGVAW